jgi:hypothetical protein
MGQPPITAIFALDDRRRPAPHAAAVARRLGVTGRVPTTVYTVAHGAAEPIELVDILGHRGGDTIMVMDAHGGGFPGDRLSDADVETVIAAGRIPVFALGPRAATRSGPDALVVAIDQSTSSDAALDFAVRWRNTFSPSEVVVAVLEAPSGWRETDEVDEVMVGHGLDGLVERVITLDPCRSICETAAVLHDPVVVVAAPSSAGTSHWYSTARRLIRSARCPVVVVPNHA